MKVKRYLTCLSRKAGFIRYDCFFEVWDTNLVFLNPNSRYIINA